MYPLFYNVKLLLLLLLERTLNTSPLARPRNGARPLNIPEKATRESALKITTASSLWEPSCTRNEEEPTDTPRLPNTPFDVVYTLRPG